MAPRTLVVAALAAALLPATMAGAAPGDPNDPLYPQQWGMQKIGAPAAWASGVTGQGITIAVVDTGVDLDHQDLAGNIDMGAARDWIDGDTHPDDPVCKGPSGAPCSGEGHGTHVAGIAAAATGNARGVAGVAPGARIMPLRVMDTDGSGTASDVGAAIDWAVAHGAHVVNLSLGEDTAIRSVLGSSITDKINEAWAKGVICVIAAGNDFVLSSSYPQLNAIVVTATTPDDTKPDYANDVHDAKWAIAAPGGGRSLQDGTTFNGSDSDYIASTYTGNQYAYMAGTSMAVPHVSGAVAALRSAGLSPQATVDRLLATADRIGSRQTFGAGRLNVARAVEGLGTAAAPPPPAGGSGPGGGGAAGGAPAPAPAPGSGGSPTAATDGRTGRPAATGPRPTVAGQGAVADPGGVETPAVEAAPVDDGTGPGVGTETAAGRRRDHGDDGLGALPVALALAGVAATGTAVNVVARRRRRPAPA